MSSVSATTWYNVQCARYGGGFVDSWEESYDGTGGRHEMLVSLRTPSRRLQLRCSLSFHWLTGHSTGSALIGLQFPFSFSP